MTTTPKPTAICACIRVTYDPIDHGDGRFSERWRCLACGGCFNRQGHIDRLTAQLAESERAREALRAAVVRVLHGDTNLEDADAVLRLFAEAVTSDNEPPVPLPEVLPAGTRTHECGGFAFETEATLTMEWCNRPHYRTMHPTGQVGIFEASEVDWAHYRAQRRAAEPTPGTVLGTARVVFRGKTEPREVEAPDAPGDRYVPTVGERAVLVSSPDPGDALYIGRDGVLIEPPRDWIRNALAPERQAYAFVPTGRPAAIGIHRDATWRPEAQPGGFLDALTARVAHLEGKTQGMAEGTAGEFRRVDDCLNRDLERLDALTKRVEELEGRMTGAEASLDRLFECAKPKSP